MSALPMNHCQMRPKIFTGSPKKNAAWRSFSNMKVGSRPGVVSRCQTTKTAASSATCQRRRYFMEPPRLRLAPRRCPPRGRWPTWGGPAPARSLLRSCRELLAISGKHLFAQHRPDRLVQLDEARRRADLGDVARPLQVDRELADRMRPRPG